MGGEPALASIHSTDERINDLDRDWGDSRAGCQLHLPERRPPVRTVDWGNLRDSDIADALDILDRPPDACDSAAEHKAAQPRRLAQRGVDLDEELAASQGRFFVLGIAVRSACGPRAIYTRMPMNPPHLDLYPDLCITNCHPVALEP